MDQKWPDVSLPHYIRHWFSRGQNKSPGTQKCADAILLQGNFR